MATEIGSKNLVINMGDTVGLTLADGTYTAGMIVVDGGSGTFSFADVVDDKEAYVLLDDVTTATDGNGAVGAVGTFNKNAVTANNDITTLGAILQKKGILLKDNTKKGA